MKIRDLIDYLSNLNGDAEISPEFDLQKWFSKPYPDKEQLHILGRGAAFGSVVTYDPDDEVSEYIKNKGEWYAAQTGILMSAARAKVFQTLREDGYLVFSHKDDYTRTAKFKFRPSDYYQFIGKYAVEPLDKEDFK